MIEDDVVGRVARLTDLLQHHLALAIEFHRIEGRLGEYVGEDVEPQRHVGLEHPRVKRGLLATRVGVEKTAHSFDLLGDVARGASARAFERHVFEHVRDAHQRARFVARAAIDPHADDRALELRHRVSRYDQPIGKTRNFDVHDGGSVASIKL